jgi:hypothetical protein
MLVTLEHDASANAAANSPPTQARRRHPGTPGLARSDIECNLACKAGSIPEFLDSVSKPCQSSLANRHIDGDWLTKWKG